MAAVKVASLLAGARMNITSWKIPVHRASMSTFWHTAQINPQPRNSFTMCLRSVASQSKKNSLASRASEFPDVIKQWHPHKNILTPQMITAASGKKCWFICEEGHEWFAALYSRTLGGAGCPTCILKKVTSTNNLLAKYPDVAAEWHPTKNGELTPKDLAHASGAKVWWLCKEGHEWKTAVVVRTHSKCGCLRCFRDRQREAPYGTQSLLATNPDLAQQWHPTKNGVLTPDAVSRGSGKKVWWQCPIDPAHEWEA
eukprot:Colp12_sorted_trinity150504_noHs@24873